MFSEEGRKEIAEDFKRTEILGESIADMTQDSVSFLGNGDGESSLREHIGNKQDYFTATKNFVNNKDNEAHVATLGNADATPAEKQAAYTALVNTIATQMGVDPTQAMVLIDTDPQFAGAYSRDTELIYLNDLKHSSAGEAVNTLGHETQHHIDNQRNPNASGSEQYTNNRENYAGIMGNATEDYLNFNFATGGYSLAGSNSNNLGANKNDIGKNLGLVSGNYDSFSSENADSLDFRLHIGQLKSFAAEMDGCTGDQCKTGVVDKYRAIANEQNGFTPNEQIVYDQAVSSITYQLMGDCNTAQCKEYIHNQMLLVSLECGSTDCIRERGMSVRNAANILARNWSDVALDATLDGLAVAGVVVPGALPGKQVVKDALSDGAEAAVRGGGQAEKAIIKDIDAPRDEFTGPYNPNVTRADLEATHGVDNVTSTTNPNKPVQSVNSNPERGIEVINGADGGKAVRVQYSDPVTGQSSTANIPYNDRGLPIFDDHAKYTTYIDHSASYQGQMRQATRGLRDAINSGMVNPNQFTQQQLKQIQSGSSKINGYTWHHNADSGNMQLIPEKIHDAVKHTGQGSLNQGR